MFTLAAVAMWRFARVQKRRAIDFRRELERLVAAGDLDEGHGAADRVPREIPRSCLTLTDKLGAGAFGEVWRVVVNESSSRRRSIMPEYMAAAKTVKESAPASATDELVREAALMAQMDPHPNIVSLVGVVTRGTPKMLLISLAQHGSLLDYLRKNSGAVEFTPARRAVAGLHVARGLSLIHI